LDIVGLKNFVRINGEKHRGNSVLM